jgi:GTPase SAR1 family protein
MTEGDPRLDVFLSSAKKEVFHPIEHRHQIWRESPFDVESVHAQAREQFQQLLAQVATPPGLDSGRICLLLGESGSGKTNLVRSFRNHVHYNGRGFVGYMQMTTAATDYNRYILSNLIDSLDQPYYESNGTTSGLLRLSNAIATRCDDPEAIEALREIPDLSQEEIVGVVRRAAERFTEQLRYADNDLDLIYALLFLQRNNHVLKRSVLKYLRCEELSPRDREYLGGIVPRRGEDDPQKLIEQFGRLVQGFDSHCLVLCVDQFEEMFQLSDAEAHFRRAMATLCTIADRVPSSIIVISCLEDYYKALRTRLTRSILDRLENDPPPVRLETERTEKEVEELISHRLGYLYETSIAGFSQSDPLFVDNPLYPIPSTFVKNLVRSRTRDVISECWKLREASIAARHIVEHSPRPSSGSTGGDTDARTVEKAKTRLEQAWNDYLAQYSDELPDDDASLVELFGWAIQACGEELESGHRFDATVKGNAINVRVTAKAQKPNKNRPLVEEIFVALCNRGPQGNGLRTQIEAAEEEAGKRTLALIRWGEFPPQSRKTLVAAKLAEVIKNGGRRAVVEDSDWRTIAAFREFRKAHEKNEHFNTWLMAENHLSRLLPIIHVLALDDLNDPLSAADSSAAPPTLVSQGAPTPVVVTPSTPPPTQTVAETKPSAPTVRAATSPTSTGPLVLGMTNELITSPVTLDPETLCSHAAFLGSTRSGKTTLALNVIEQLALRGIPAILVDRKGDLAGYARDDLWEKPQANLALREIGLNLRQRIDVALFTPGSSKGRQLAISVIPSELTGLNEEEREQAARHAADALGGMLDYKHTGRDKALRVILAQAIHLLATYGDPQKLDLSSLIEFIDSASPSLVHAVGKLDLKLFNTLVQNLETLRLSAKEVLSADGEKLDAELLFGLGPHARPGRTRLSIISTKSLGNNAKILFWVSQLLLSLNRWVARSPSPRLQGVVLFDEADVYLPAQSQPATKAPLENLLRRARSGGLGILLATQSPGDLDYKCRDNIRSWFVGRVTQQVALEKMKPLLNDARVNVANRIPGQETGEFHLIQDGQVTAFKSERSFLNAEQVPDDELLALAARRRPSAP